MRGIIVPLFAILALPLPAIAEQSLLSKKFAACMKQANGTTLSLLECTATELKAQDDRLNAAYKRLGASLKPERKDYLVASQRRWMQYRDADCGLQAELAGKQFELLRLNNCFLYTTAIRANQLEEYNDSDR